MSTTINGIDLQDKVVLVTGAARGIGAAIARRCAEAGAAVMVTTGSSAADARAVVESIEAAGGKADFQPLDVRDNAQWQSVVDQTVDTFGGLDVLVNNAGIATLKFFVDLSLEDLRQTMEINLDGAFLGMQHAIRVMRPQGSAGKGGSIVNIGSVSSLNAYTGASHYAASKGALKQLGKGVADESARMGYGVRVNTVCPGMVRTDMLPVLYQGYVDLGLVPSLADAEAMLGQMAPLGLGEPADVANMVLYLASDAARWVTGTEHVIDGGLLIS
jgi:3alpha(or 20beta)-hydroxysteroid dehydrogenase